MNNKDLAEINREKTTKKVMEAIQKLKKKKIKISISAVAKEAAITRQTLYNRTDLKIKIDEANALLNDQSKSRKRFNKLGIQEERIKRLQEIITQLKEENIKLLDQNVFLTEDKMKLERKIADLEEKLYKDNVVKILK